MAKKSGGNNEVAVRQGFTVLNFLMDSILILFHLLHAALSNDSCSWSKHMFAPAQG